MQKTPTDLRLDELVETAIEYDIVTEDENSSFWTFEDETIGKNKEEIISLLQKDKELLLRILEAVKEYEQDEDIDEDEEEDPNEEDDNDEY